MGRYAGRSADRSGGICPCRLLCPTLTARSHLAMIERGTKSPSVDTLWRIAEALDMPLSSLMLLIEEAHRRQA